MIDRVVWESRHKFVYYDYETKDRFIDLDCVYKLVDAPTASEAKISIKLKIQCLIFTTQVIYHIILAILIH